MAELRPDIILQGRAPNILGAMAQGMQLRAARDEMARGNALQQLYAQQGAGLMAGEEGAYNALAALDPVQAMNLRSSRLGQQATAQGMAQADERMEMDRETMRMRVEELTRTASREEIEAEAADAARKAQGMMAAYMQGPEAFAQAGFDVPYEQVPQVYAQATGALDVVAEVLAGPQTDYSFQGGQWWRTGGGQPPVAVTEAEGEPYERFRAVGGNIWDYGPEGSGQPPALLPGQGEEEVIFGPDGQPIVARGSAGVGTRFTESQSKDVVYSTRARSALERLGGMGEAGTDALTSYRQAATELVPFIGRSLQSDEYQVASQAGQEFLAAILRKDTGAAITNEEQRIYGSLYLPQPGDGAAVLTAKAQAREQAVRAIEGGMGADQLAAQARAMIDAAQQAPQAAPAAPGGSGFTPAPQGAPAAPAGSPAAPAGDFTQMPREQLLQLDVTTMTYEQLQAWNAALDALDGQGR